MSKGISFHCRVRIVSICFLLLYPALSAVIAGTYGIQHYLLLALIGSHCTLLFLPGLSGRPDLMFYISVLYAVFMFVLPLLGVNFGLSCVMQVSLPLLYLSVSVMKGPDGLDREVFAGRMAGRLVCLNAVELMVILSLILHGLFLWSVLLILFLLYLLHYILSYRIPLTTRKHRENACGLEAKPDIAPPMPGEKEYRSGEERMNDLYGKIQRYMEVNKPFLEDKFSMEDMASCVFSNNSYVSRTVNRCFGGGFRKFVNGYRVRYAIELMKEDPHRRIGEVATSSGFGSSVSFTSAFKKETGMTPSEYMRSIQSELIS